jgi:hypothetical protein
MNKLDLSYITLIAVDCVDIERLKTPFKISTDYCEFKRNILITDYEAYSKCNEFNKDVTIICLSNKLDSGEKYSEFMIKQLNNYVDSPYCLHIQYDGYVLNPKAWTNDYLNYDYIGAAWDHGPISTVGNGGFSLRSKQLLEILALDNNIKVGHPEDHYICRSGLNYEYLISKDIKFAPIEVAKKFSIEGNNCNGHNWSGQFGFHNKSITNISNWKFEDNIL